MHAPSIIRAVPANPVLSPQCCVSTTSRVSLIQARPIDSFISRNTHAPFVFKNLLSHLCYESSQLAQIVPVDYRICTCDLSLIFEYEVFLKGAIHFLHDFCKQISRHHILPNHFLLCQCSSKNSLLNWIYSFSSSGTSSST